MRLPPHSIRLRTVFDSAAKLKKSRGQWARKLGEVDDDGDDDDGSAVEFVTAQPAAQQSRATWEEPEERVNNQCAAATCILRLSQAPGSDRQSGKGCGTTEDQDREDGEDWGRG
ncbi:hypothetical protein CMUS01_00690 [Colletotrichum musicola]|uniref:Uncharacterized protein n=1 Tax=Colletotrichum musicola TaxID=2175873 RepID=A0A8H6NYP7_9PEZI|nr:hypothetical protein CMUS01_00690 [Colletotrichum musicola]